MVFKAGDPAYAATLLTHAKQLYSFADTYRGTYDKCITAAQGYYNSWSGYWDELVWGAIWLYRATGDSAYLVKAETYYAQLPKMQQTNTPEYKWTLAWDDKSYGAYVLLAELTGKQTYIDDAERWLDWWTTGVTGQKITYSSGGEAFLDTWGPLRYSANTAYVALQFGGWLNSRGKDAAKAQAYQDFGARQIDYILGDNPAHESYEIGFTNSGKNSSWPQNPHSRAAHGSWSQSMTEPAATRHVDYGLLVGGPGSADDGYSDERSNYGETEGALDYNAGFSGALAMLTDQYGGTPRAGFPGKETPDGPEEFMQAAVNATGTNFYEIKAQVVNKSGWPARHLTHGSFRYYFTLDPGTSPSQVTLTSAYNQCSAPTGPTQFAGSVYYVTISCEGQDIAPAGQSAFHREVQFRLAFPGAHDPTEDWSYQGVSRTPGSTPVTVDHIVLYDGATAVWGVQPGDAGDPDPDSPPSAPAGLQATAVTQTSATLSWTASAPGSLPLAGYQVFADSGSGPVSVGTSTGTSLTAIGLTAATPYMLTVKALDTAGSTSAASVPVRITTKPATGGASCAITYTVTGDWGNGFQSDAKIANTGAAAVNGWTATWVFGGDQQVSNAWNGTLTQSGQTVTARNAGHNATIPPGGSVSLGFTGTYHAGNTAPHDFTLNGAPCDKG